jgi:hypothetical protein
MAATRNRNTPEDYRLEKNQSIRPCDFSTYVQSPYGVATNTYFPGNGLIGARVPRSELSTNSCDIENMLFGLGSCSLEIQQAKVVPQIQPLKSLNIIDRIPMLVPEPIVVDTTKQRPMYLN